MSILESTILIVILVFAMRFCKQGSCSRKHLGWGKAIVVLVLLALAANFLSSRVAKRHAVEQARKTRVAQLEQKASMQEQWERLTQPRIKIERDEHGAPSTVSDGASSDETPDSHARARERLERVVEQVSTLADQMSDVGTIVGKAMIALNETVDARRQPAVPSTAVEAQSSRKQASKMPATPDATDKARNTARPAWVDEPARRVGNTWRQVIVTEEFVTDEECYVDADARLRAAVAEHMRHLVQAAMQSAAVNVPPLEQMGIGIDYIRHEIAVDEYLETVQRSFGPMKKIYTLVEFSPSIDTELRQRWDEYRRQGQFALVSLGAGSVLGIMGVVFGLLKVDTWTKGYYTKRLFIGFPAAIIGLVTLLAIGFEGNWW